LTLKFDKSLYNTAMYSTLNDRDVPTGALQCDIIFILYLVRDTDPCIESPDYCNDKVSDQHVFISFR